MGLHSSRLPGAGAIAALLVLSAVAAAADPPYADSWDPVTVGAAEAAVARLGPRRALSITATIRDIRGLEKSVAGAGTGIVASVQEVRKAMQELGAKETQMEIRVELPADVLFDFDEADIRPDAAAALGHLATLVRAHPGRRVRLEGHTDAEGSDAYNQGLSERRARAVQSWLVEKEGIPAAGFVARGFGESRPVASNDTEEGRQRNRRVEVVIEKGEPE
jgi:outer membrane protein OmpA-like peptidoglycan-associated protein